MSRFFIRKEPGWRETLSAAVVAAGAAVGVAAISFYLTRAFLSREVLDPLPGRGPGGSEKNDEGAHGIDSRGGST